MNDVNRNPSVSETGYAVQIDCGCGRYCSGYFYGQHPHAVVLADLIARELPAWPLPGERAHQDALWFCSGGDQLL